MAGSLQFSRVPNLPASGLKAVRGNASRPQPSIRGLLEPPRDGQGLLETSWQESNIKGLIFLNSHNFLRNIQNTGNENA